MIRVTSRIIAPVVFAALIIGIGLSMAFNIWITESSKVPATYEEGSFAGQYNPADIRGSYSLSDIEKSFGIEVDVMVKAFSLSIVENPADFKVKELEEMYGPAPDGGEIGTDAVRLFVSRYKGLPYTPEDTTRLPAPALNQLRDRLAPADIEALEALSVQPGEMRVETAGDGTTTEHAETDEKLIKGVTTFGELLEWGLSREEIESVLGIEMGPKPVSIRDYLIENEMEFSAVKAELQTVADSKEQ